MANNTRQPSGPPVGGFISLLSGMHAGVAPEVLEETAYSRGINVSAREGLVKTRPGFVRETAELPAGVYQGMAAWHLHSGARLVLGLGGQLAVFEVETGKLTTFRTGLSATSPFFFCQAERFFVVQDGIHPAVVLQEGASGEVQVRPEAHQIPIGTAMAFAHGRLHLTPNEVGGENGRPYLQSGDVFKARLPADCLNFTETNYLNEGGAHGVPLESGYIYAFAPLRNASTGTGYGSLVVFSQRGVSAYDMSIPRDQWKAEALSQVLYFGPGTRSPWAVVPINGTLLFRGLDGLRLLSYSVSAAQDTGGSTLAMVPQSTEVAPFMTRADSAYLRRVSAAVADNRAFVTVGGSDGVWFKALVVADFARLSSMKSPQTEAAYDGIWQIEGRRFGGVCSAVRGDEEALYAYMDDGKIWRLDNEGTSDAGAPIRSRLVTRTLFLDSMDYLRVSNIQLWLRGLTQDGSVTVYSRPMGYPLWDPRGTVTYRVAPGSLPQRRRALQIPVESIPSSAAVDPQSREFLARGTGHQFALEWTGPAVVEVFRVSTEFVDDAALAPCNEAEESLILPIAASGVDLGEYL